MPVELFVGLAAALAAAVLVGVVGPRYLKMRGKRVVTCPETKHTVAVKVAAGIAAAGGSMRLSDCTRWPERAGCGQDCLREIQASPDGCLVRSVLDRWYAGKSCAFCNKAFERVSWESRRPGLMTADAQILDLQNVPAESLPEVLETSVPVCWNCFVTETFRRAHPELVLDRNR